MPAFHQGTGDNAQRHQADDEKTKRENRMSHDKRTSHKGQGVAPAEQVKNR
jgi:hypothetical protein